MEPVKVGARSGIYRTLHRPTRTRHQEPNATNARRSRPSVFHRGIHHTQICGAATPEQWEALIFSGMELCNSARRLTIEMGVPPALPGRQSNFENSGSIPPAVAFVFAEARCLASLVPLQLLLLFTGCDQAPLRGQQP